MNRPVIRWSPADETDLLAMAVAGGSFEDFAERRNCSVQTVQARYVRLLAQMTTEGRAEARRLRATHLKNAVGLSRSAAEKQLAERDARRGIEHRDLTAAVFGDPLPGRSALDQMAGRSA